MRLSKPAFATEPAFFVEAPDFAHGSFNHVEPTSVFGADSLETFEVSEILKLPLNFGSIFLGENFSCYICVNNESTASVRDLGLKAELQVNCLVSFGMKLIGFKTLPSLPCRLPHKDFR